MTNATPLASATSTAACIRILEQAFGDPAQPDNPFGLVASLATDERAEAPRAAADVLAGLGINAEFVPVAHRGRLNDLGRMTQILRTVARRDTAVAFSLAVSAVLAAGPVWRVGSAQQCARAADILLANKKLACAPRDLLCGASSGPTVTAAPTGLVLEGRQEVIGFPDPEAVVSLVRRADGTRSTFPVLLDMSDLLAGGVRVPGVRPLPGIPGVPIGEVTYSNFRLTGDSALGATNVGAIEAAQIARIVMPSMAIGIVDTALRVTLTYAARRRLYGSAVLDFPRTRAVLADVFADLLLCDAVCEVATRATHLLPHRAEHYADVVQLLVPRLLVVAMTSLSELLGATFFIRDGEFGIVQKLLRDIRTLAFDYSSGLAGPRRADTRLPPRESAAPGGVRFSTALFSYGGQVPELDFGGPCTTVAKDDPVLSALASYPEDWPRGAGDLAEVRKLALWFRTAADEMIDGSPGNAVQRRSSARRYASVVAAGACLGFWFRAPDTDEFRADPAWVRLALVRVARRLGARPPIPSAARERLVAELITRYERVMTFDLGSYRTTR